MSLASLQLLRARQKKSKALENIKIHSRKYFGRASTADFLSQEARARDIISTYPRCLHVDEDQWLSLMGACDGCMASELDRLNVLDCVWPFDSFSVRYYLSDGFQLWHHGIEVFWEKYKGRPAQVRSLRLRDFSDDSSLSYTASFTRHSGLTFHNVYSGHTPDTAAHSIICAALLSDDIASCKTAVIRPTSVRELSGPRKPISKQRGRTIVIRPGLRIVELPDMPKYILGSGRAYSPRRRHMVRSFTRVRLGKIEFVRSFVRGGKRGFGPDYQLASGVVKVRAA